jgi:hypothetical protein
MGSLRKERERRSWTLDQVADAIRQLGHEHGHHNLGIDANAVSRHERGVIAFPRHPYPRLYAQLYGTEIRMLWPLGKLDGMNRRTFLQAIAAASGGALLDGGDDLQAMLAITSGLRRLEATTPVAELRRPVGAHLRLVGRRAGRGPAYAAAAAEVARFAAFMAWDQRDHRHARALYGRAVSYARRSRSDVLVSCMHGSWALWAAETGQGVEARRVEHLVQPARPITLWLHAMRATVASSVGDADTTLAALQDAEHALEAEQTPSLPGIYPLTHAKLQGYVGRCYVRLGLHKAAVPALQEALDGMARTKQRAVLLLDLAHAVGGDDAQELRHEARQIGEELQSRKVLARCS